MVRCSVLLILSLVCLVLNRGFQPGNKLFLLAEYDDQFEPPFPRLNLRNGQLKLISETTDPIEGYQMIEEYTDFDELKFVRIITTTAKGSTGRKVTYSSGRDQTNFIYGWPSWCQLLEDSPSHDLLSSYKFVITKQMDSMSSSDASEDTNKANLPTKGKVSLTVTGLTAIWLIAGTKPKVYSRNKVIYSPSEGSHRTAMKWTFREPPELRTIGMHFIEDGLDPVLQSPMLKLETINLEAYKTKEGIQSFNVILKSNSIDEETQQRLLEPPIGFGCYKSISEAPKWRSFEATLDRLMGSQAMGADGGWSSLVDDSFVAQGRLMSLEVTATRYDGQADGRSEVLNVELALGSGRPTVGLSVDDSSLNEQRNNLFLFRKRNSHQDVKLIIDSSTQVGYQIDTRRGECKMSHLSGKDRDEATRLTFQIEPLRLDLNLDALELLFYTKQEFVLIKQTSNPNNHEQALFFELTISIGPQQSADRSVQGTFRLIRKYLSDTLRGTLKLESVTIWKLDSQNGGKILESYHLRVFEMRQLLPGWPDEAKIFDISEECYLNNDNMLPNRDYNWIQFHYPLPSHELNLILANELEFKHLFYNQYLGQKLDILRAPRLELMPDNEGITMRILLLDLPPNEILFELEAGVSIQLSLDHSAYGDEKIYSPDLSHCSRLCRLNYCSIMTYCSMSHVCIMNNLNPGRPVAQNRFLTDCNTYKLPQADKNDDSSHLKQQLLRSKSLKSLIGQYRHQNYKQTLDLPERPKILSEPRNEQSNEMEYYLALNGYLHEIMTALGEHTTLLPELSIVTHLSGHFFLLIPNRFQIEQTELPISSMNRGDYSDGLELMEDIDESDAASGQMPAFHEALQMFRYKRQQFVADDTEAEHIGAHFQGFTYDQCALACLDAKCGSFSYCSKQLDCTLSSLNNTSKAAKLDLLEQDLDCVVLQRDYLAHFIRFDSSQAPESFERQWETHDASECALNCVSETNFRCLAFDYCVQQTPPGVGHSGDPMVAPRRATCYYQTTRFSTTRSVGMTTIASDANRLKTNLQCQHYTRSYLADFKQLEYSRLSAQAMDQLETTSFPKAHSVFNCAEFCVTELPNCVGFQLCLNHPQTSSQPDESEDPTPPNQGCTMIESRLAAIPRGSGPSMDSNGDDDSSSSNGYPSAKQLLIYEPNCHLFTLRGDSNEALLRDVASNMAPIKARTKSRDQPSQSRDNDELAIMDQLFEPQPVGQSDYLIKGVLLLSGIFLLVSIGTCLCSCWLAIWFQTGGRMQYRIMERIRIFYPY